MAKYFFESGNKNPNWKGGRIISSHGYVLIKVSKDHPLACKNGYAYEHRLIAEAKLGRPLKTGEVVHHKDGNKQNNSFENIDVIRKNNLHLFIHRKSDSILKNPNELNLPVLCECGCGAVFDKYDCVGRPRKFVSGHNMRRNINADENTVV